MSNQPGREEPYRSANGSSADAIGQSTTCPFCGLETDIERELDPELGPVSVDELETLVRNEWRHRLGPPAYAREHSRTIIRALIVYALVPESPVRATVLQQLIWWELVTLGAMGMSRESIDREFSELAQAVRNVLGRAGLDGSRASVLAQHIDRKLQQALEWPERAVQAEERDG